MCLAADLSNHSYSSGERKPLDQQQQPTPLNGPRYRVIRRTFALPPPDPEGSPQPIPEPLPEEQGIVPEYQHHRVFYDGDLEGLSSYFDRHPEADPWRSRSIRPVVVVCEVAGRWRLMKESPF